MAALPTRFLDGPLKQAIAKGFRGRLLKGTLRRKAVPGVNSRGDPSSTTDTDYTCEGMVDAFSAFYAKQAGIPETDVRVLLIAGLVSTVPVKDDRVQFRGVWYQLRRLVEADPAGATYTFAGFQVREP